MQTPRWHSKGREEPGMVFSHDKKPSFPYQRAYDKDQPKRNFYIDSWPLPDWWSIFMQMSYNITGQKNGANIWRTSEHLIYVQCFFGTTRTIRCVVSFSRYHPNIWRKAPMKSLPDNHETTRATVSMNKEAGQNPQSISRRNKFTRRSGPREARMANMDLTQLEMVLRGEPDTQI